MNKDQIKGRVKEVDGNIKEATGKALGNQRLEEKGKIEKTIGKVQAGLGDLREDLKK